MWINKWLGGRLQRDLNPWPRDTGATLLPTKLWSHLCWELVNYKFATARIILHLISFPRFSYMIYFIHLSQKYLYSKTAFLFNFSSSNYIYATSKTQLHSVNKTAISFKEIYIFIHELEFPDPRVYPYSINEVPGHFDEHIQQTCPSLNPSWYEMFTHHLLRTFSCGKNVKMADRERLFLS